MQLEPLHTSITYEVFSHPEQNRFLNVLYSWWTRRTHTFSIGVGKWAGIGGYVVVLSPFAVNALLHSNIYPSICNARREVVHSSQLFSWAVWANELIYQKFEVHMFDPVGICLSFLFYWKFLKAWIDQSYEDIIYNDLIAWFRRMHLSNVLQ